MSFILGIFRLPLWTQCWHLIIEKAATAHSLVIRFLFGEHWSLNKAGVDLVKLSSKGYLGSTAIFFRVRPGVILKAPVTMLEDQIIRQRPSVSTNFNVEQRVLEKLGDHPRIVQYLGWQTEFPTGLLFSEASSGSLQRFIDEHNDKIRPDIRSKWVLQAIESIAYIHNQGVLHSDLRPDNFLVHGPELDLWLCDFGGSTSEELGLSANKLPDAGFFDPKLSWTPSPAVDIFSLGSVIYFIGTGHWPFRGPGGQFDSGEEMEAYEKRVEDYFRQGIFPVVDGLLAGDIILGCWTHAFSSMEEVMKNANSLQFGTKH